jgi:hypothetical protein
MVRRTNGWVEYTEWERKAGRWPWKGSWVYPKPNEEHMLRCRVVNILELSKDQMEPEWPG